MFSILLTYGKLNATQEIAVLRTGGMSMHSLAMPAFMLTAACLIIGVLFSCYLGPKGAKRTNQLIRHVLTTRAPYSIKEGVFTSSFRDVVMFAGKKTAPNAMRDVFIYDERDPKRPRVMTAREGKIKSPDGQTISMELTEGTMHMGDRGSATDITFERYLLNLPIEAEVTRVKFTIAELTPPEMLLALSKQEVRLDTRKYNLTIMELHRRFTLPLMSLAVALFSVPLSFMAGKTGKLGGVGLGLAIIVGFYVLSATMESLFKAGTLPHTAAGWTPLMALLALSIYFYKREAAR